MPRRFPDTSVFEGKHAEEFYGWSCEIRAKLKADAECYATAEDAVFYITLRCKGDAALKVARWTPEKEVNTRDEVIEAVLGYLENAFGDPCRRSRASNKLIGDEFQQGGRPFWKFRREFESAWDQLDYPDRDKVFYFREKLSAAMRESMAIEMFDEGRGFNEFARFCSNVALSIENRKR